MWPTLLLPTKTITHLHIGTFFVRNCSLLAARNETTLSAVALLSFHEFPIVLFLRSPPSSPPYVHLYHASVPCKLFVERSENCSYEGEAELGPRGERSTLTCITPCRITLGFRHVERVHTCLRTVICVRVGVTGHAAPTRGRPWSTRPEVPAWSRNEPR